MPIFVRSRRLGAGLVLTVAACGSPNEPGAARRSEVRAPPAPAAREPSSPPPVAAPAPVAKESLEFDDIWEVIGVGRGATEAQIVAALGRPTRRELDPSPVDGRDNVILGYEPGVEISLRPSGGIMVLLDDRAGAMRARFPADPALSLLGQSCAEADRRLNFMDEVRGFRSCKHYSGEWFLDVTLHCWARQEKITKVVVVWEPLPLAQQREAKPADHCN